MGVPPSSKLQRQIGLPVQLRFRNAPPIQPCLVVVISEYVFQPRRRVVCRQTVIELSSTLRRCPPLVCPGAYPVKHLPLVLCRLNARLSGLPGGLTLPRQRWAIANLHDDSTEAQASSPRSARVRKVEIRCACSTLPLPGCRIERRCIKVLFPSSPARFRYCFSCFLSITIQYFPFSFEI